MNNDLFLVECGNTIDQLWDGSGWHHQGLVLHHQGLVLHHQGLVLHQPYK